jgi:hypothetical protein
MANETNITPTQGLEAMLNNFEDEISKGGNFSEALKETLAESKDFLKLQGKTPLDFLNQIADRHPEHAGEIKRLARENNPYLIKSLDGFNDFLKKYNEANNYTCRVFPKSNFESLVFSPATIGFIGARTSRGKTTALVSVAMDALEQGKKVFFTTMEESQHQIFLRFILHILFNGGYYPEQEKEIVKNEIWEKQLKETKFNPKRTILKILREEAIGNIFNDEQMTKKFIENVLFAKEKLNEYLTSGQLALYNGLESPTFEYMINAIADNEAGTICLLDYMQKVKAPEKFINNTTNRFALLQEASNTLASTVKKTSIILICGAQFGRTGEKQKSTELDLFTDESFQECSAIEQAGEIEIGIGRHFRNGTKHTYYAILKDRDNGEYNPSIYYELTDLAKFSKFTPARREETTDGRKHKNLIEYYNQDTDKIDGETTAERNKRKEYKNKKGKNNQVEENNNDSTDIPRNELTEF